MLPLDADARIMAMENVFKQDHPLDDFAQGVLVLQCAVVGGHVGFTFDPIDEDGADGFLRLHLHVGGEGRTPKADGGVVLQGFDELLLGEGFLQIPKGRLLDRGVEGVEAVVFEFQIIDGFPVAVGVLFEPKISA